MATSTTPAGWTHGENDKKNKKLVDDLAQVSPADLPILRVGIDCTLTQLLDKGFLHAVRLSLARVRTETQDIVYSFFPAPPPP